MATRPEAAAMSTVVSSLSPPPLTIAFQLACSAAPKRTTRKTVRDIAARVPGG